ncbi:hypothetical protein BKA93DRAFT_729396 [Sparassis latifolia]
MRCIPFFSFLFAVPVTVFACEGECIVGITNAFLTNYSDPIHAVMNNVATQISAILPSNPSPSTSLGYLSPIFSAYKKQAYNGMETAIFPDYFHGKCQQNGVDPAGCPNPDCPVVCGTPGSMVHFYPVLRFLAFNYTRTALQELSMPGSPTNQQVEASVMNAAREHTRRISRVFPRSLMKSMAKSATIVPLFLKKRTQDISSALQKILAKIPGLLVDACGGSADTDPSGLPDCSWEERMKEYILTFP